LTTLAEALTAAGRMDEAQLRINQAVAMAESSGCLFHWPEILRVKALIMELSAEADQSKVEALFWQSISAARRQAAVFWEMRTSISLVAFECRRKGPSAAKITYLLCLKKHEKKIGIFGFLKETKIVTDINQEGNG
jgi:hypothetical protein